MNRTFRRGIRSEALSTLRAMAEAPEENWWKELLRLWTPSGRGDGLRLAVRENTLDFYRKGNVVAHVGFGQCKKGECAPAYVKTHIKYLRGESAGGSYIKLMKGVDGWNWSDGAAPISFSTIKENIDLRMKGVRDAGSEKGMEKVGVDTIVGSNAAVIDLEMALPLDVAIPGSVGAPRMDLVALEKHGNEIRIVFWEAKTFDDPRLRIDGDSAAEVNGQLDTYSKYLANSAWQAAIISAYRETCELLKEFWSMRGERGPLHPLVDAAPRGDLNIDEKPRLVIFDNGSRTNIDEDPYWQRHRKKLVNAGIELLVKDRASEITLPVWCFTSEQYAALAAFNDTFSSSDFVFSKFGDSSKSDDGVITLGEEIFTVDANRFVNFAYDCGWVLDGFKYSEWMTSPEGKFFWSSPENLKQASGEQIAKLLTTFVRGDRFCEGTLSTAADEGFLTAMMRRADELARANAKPL
ncbi:MAG: hypothetical protein KGQ46_02185 [Hyphomicrobiales bacterium]|nr:hypothetical protein [Hyphomicrobiales bacterium]MDE2116069.1 hypothetical protein [Hyphomicrobiales bacterium]